MKHANPVRASELRLKLFRKHVRVGEPDQCWAWTGHLNRRGYGVTQVWGRRLLAHRVAYALAYNADIDAGLVVRHKCDNPGCVNPSHLELGAQADNMHDMRERGRDLRGCAHPNSKLTPEKADCIRSLYGAGGVSMSHLAKMFGVGVRTVHAVVHNKRRIFRPEVA